jgi:hypothetical protein
MAFLHAFVFSLILISFLTTDIICDRSQEEAAKFTTSREEMFRAYTTKPSMVCGATITYVLLSVITMFYTSFGYWQGNFKSALAIVP